MPNSGSDWFVDTILKSNSYFNYYREFFNPIVNIKYTDILKDEFGCESALYYKNISRFNHDVCNQIFKKTWDLEKYNFTKEIYSAFKVDFFYENFNCICLIRDVENSLPGSRGAAVRNWYDAIYASILKEKENFDNISKNKINEFLNYKTNFFEKHVFSYCFYKKILINNCKNKNIKILKYENLCNLDEKNLQKILKPFSDILNINSWVETIVSTRKLRKTNFEKTNCKWILNKFFNEKFI